MTAAEKPNEPGESSSVEVTPPIAPPPVIPSPEKLPSDVRIIDVSLANRSDEMPKGLKFPDLLVIVTGSKARTENLESLIWSTTGLLALGLGSISGIAIFALHYRVAGSVGLASATIAGIMSLVARIRLRKKGDSK
jgi:hypothetical protein